MVVLRFEFHHNGLSGFEAVRGQNMPIPIDLAIGLYITACRVVQAVVYDFRAQIQATGSCSKVL